MSRQQNDLQKKFQEQEETIRELALKLEVSIKREDEFREKDGLRSSTWMKDEDVKDCCQCKKRIQFTSTKASLPKVSLYLHSSHQTIRSITVIFYYRLGYM